MFYVTHDQEEALALGDRVAVLHCGQLQQVDRPDVLYERPSNRFVANSWLAGDDPPTARPVLEDGRLALVHQTDVFHLGSVRQEEWRPFVGRRVGRWGFGPKRCGPRCKRRQTPRHWTWKCGSSKRSVQIGW